VQSVVNHQQLLKFLIFESDLKTYAIILAIYLLGGMFVPCADNTDNQVNLELSITTGIPYQQQPSGSFDLCTALCSCHCCHSHVTFMLLENHISEIAVSETIKNTFSGFISEPSFSIWQPPKA